MSASEVSDAAFIRQFLVVLALLIIWTVASAFLGRGLAAKAVEEQKLNENAVKSRIMPVGTVMTTAAAAAPAKAAAAPPKAVTAPVTAPKVVAAPKPAPAAQKPMQVAAADDNAAGEKIYKTACFACHGTGLPNVPKLGDAAAWEPRAAKGMAALMESVIKGRGAMPPRAANPSLTDAELEAAVKYMLKESGVTAG